MLGFLNVHKPQWKTSHDVVAPVRTRLPRRAKVGHAGTLDPFATGVLVLCIGKATRLASYVQRQPKRYAAEVTLGATSTTDDPEGDIQPTPGAEPVSADAARRALDSFVGEIEQVPPTHSAVHAGGRRAYELARRGRRFELKARRVTIHHIALARYEWPVVELDVHCGAGTYLRALARDLGAALGVGGYCSALTRTEVGPFTLDAAVALGDLDLERDLVPVPDGLPFLPRVRVAAALVARLCSGQAVSPGDELPAPQSEVLVLDEAGAAVALGRVGPDGQTVQPRRVLIPWP